MFACSEDKWLGVGYLSSYLKKNGHQTSLLFDPLFFNKAYVRNERLKRLFHKEVDFIRQINEFKPDLIGFAVLAANYQWALNMAAIFKKNFDVPIIFGGPHATIIPDEVISNPQVDMIAVGEAEESLLELANKGVGVKDIRGVWFKNAGRIIRNQPRELQTDIDKFPFPDDELFYKQLPSSYRITPSVITSRGCPFNCTYCGNQIMQKIHRDAGAKQWVRRRSVDNVIAELVWRKEKHGSRHFVFMDDIFCSDTVWLRDFVKKYKEKVGLSFNCLAHVSLIDEEAVGLLKEAGCTLIDFGLQTGSPSIRSKILQRYEKNEEVLKIAEVCRKHKLKFALDCILNLPGDTEDTVKESLSLFNEARPNMVNCFPLSYLPGTKIVEIAYQRGVLNAQDLELINKGRHLVYFSLGVNKRVYKDDYSKYSFLFVALPVISKKYLKKIINSQKLFQFYQKVPRIFLVFARMIVQFRSGFWFIFSNVINNEMFYFKSYIFRRHNSRISLEVKK
jgi:radical SAM superfamily enzyme YgiQ (UPF0313 family)